MITVVFNPTEVILEQVETALSIHPKIIILRADDREQIGHIEFSRLVFQCANYDDEVAVTTDATKMFKDTQDSDYGAILVDVIETLIAQFNWALEPEFKAGL